jgi:hypothetical protein
MDTTYGRDWFIETLPEVVDLVANGWIDGYVEGWLRVTPRACLRSRERC